MVSQRAGKKYSIVCICQVYNEIEKGNLPRFVKFVKPLVDNLVVWDDASTDGSYEYVLQHTPHVLRSKRTDFKNEMKIKQTLLDYALKFKPDFIMYLDADEVFSANAAHRLQELCLYCRKNHVDGLSFHKLNLWRSKSWKRADNLYDQGWFVHLWRVKRGMTYGKTRRGLHLPPYPVTVRRIERVDDVQVIHYGFSSERLIASKYLTYQAYGQRGYGLNRLIDESGLELKKVPRSVYPRELYVDDSPPRQLTIQEAFAYVEKYRRAIVLPELSIVQRMSDFIGSTPSLLKVKMIENLPSCILRYLDLGWDLVRHRRETERRPSRSDWSETQRAVGISCRSLIELHAGQKSAIQGDERDNSH